MAARTAPLRPPLPDRGDGVTRLREGGDWYLFPAGGVVMHTHEYERVMATLFRWGEALRRIENLGVPDGPSWNTRDLLGECARLAATALNPRLASAEVPPPEDSGGAGEQAPGAGASSGGAPTNPPLATTPPPPPTPPPGEP